MLRQTEIFNVHKQNIISIQIFMLPKPYILQWYVYNNEALLVIIILIANFDSTGMPDQVGHLTFFIRYKAL
jgi:hypothetical protein